VSFAKLDETGGFLYDDSCLKEGVNKMFRYKYCRLVVLFFTIIVTLGALFYPVSASSGNSHPWTLIRNASLILTMDPNVGEGALGIIEGGDILLEGDTIAAVGENFRGRGARVVDATGKIVMPGFVDTHNHLWQSLIRGCGTDDDVNGWLYTCVYPLMWNPDITPSRTETYAGARLTTLDLIDTGVTTVVDWSHAMTPDFVRGSIQASCDSGLRFVYAYYGSDNPAVVADMKLVKQTLIDPNPLANFQVASHPGMESWLFSNLQTMSNLAKELDVKLHVHLLESIVQRDDQPIKALELVGALGPDLICGHSIHLTDEEIATLADHDVRAEHNPLSNLRLASGIMRLSDMKQAGVQVALGSDGGTNDTSNFFDTMRVAVGLQRVMALRADVYPTVADILRLATLGGAEVLDMDDQIGSITPGKKADLIVLNPHTLNFAPRFNWVSQIVFNGQPVNVEWVFVNGRPLKERGRLVGVRRNDIVRAAEEAASRIRQDLQNLGGEDGDASSYFALESTRDKPPLLKDMRFGDVTPVMR
jgi:5-methylthioadenosine/S-adenosylhomocysteine deaminase